AKSQINRVSEFAVGGPLGELDLRDELGPDPVWMFVRLWGDRERRPRRLERFQQLPDASQLLAVEARAGMARVYQVAAVVHAEQQRTKICAGLTRLGPSADHELLLVDEFELAPVRRSLPRPVERRGVLGDETFPSLFERPLVKRAAIAASLVADAQQ